MKTKKKKKEKIFGIQRNIFFLGLTSFFNDFSSEMVFSVFPVFFVSVLKAGAASLGIVEGLAEAFANIFKIYSGNLSDKVQKRKPFVVFGYILSTLTRPFYVLVSTVGGVAGLRVLDRIGKGTRDAPRDAIISISSPRGEVGRSFGYHRSMDVFGAILGPLVAYLILKYFPMRFDIVFVSAFFVGIVAVVTLGFVSDVKNHFKLGPVGIVKSFVRLSARFKFFLLSVFIFSSGTVPVAILLLKTESIGLAIATIPLFYMVYNISFSIFSVTAGKMGDQLGVRKTLSMGYLILLISYFALYSAQEVNTLIIGFLLLGMFSAFTDGNQRSLASKLSTEDLRGGALGLISAANGFGALIAGFVGGYLWQMYSPAVAFFTAAIVVSVGLVLFSVTLVSIKGRI